MPIRYLAELCLGGAGIPACSLLQGGPNTPVVRNIVVQDVTCKSSKYALYLRGYESSPIHDIALTRCKFENVAKPDVIENVQGLTTDDFVVKGKLVSRG